MEPRLGSFKSAKRLGRGLVNTQSWPQVHAAASARVAPEHLRRLPEGPQEGAAHAVAIGKTRLPRDNDDRVEVVDRLGRSSTKCCLFFKPPGGMGEAETSAIAPAVTNATIAANWQAPAKVADRYSRN